jgi:hypothetical protein
VEGLVGYFMTPLPVAESYEALNARFLDACTKRRQALLRGLPQLSPSVCMDVAAFIPLPPAPYDACHKIATRVSSLSLVRYKNNDYSVPTRYGHQEVLAKDMSTGSRSPVAARRSPRIPAAMIRPILSSILCII